MFQPLNQPFLSRSAERLLRITLLLLVTVGNAGLIACAPIIRCFVSESACSTPIEEEETSETYSEAIDGLEHSGAILRAQRSPSRISRLLHPLLSQFRIDQQVVLSTFVNAMSQRFEFSLLNGCGATLRC